MSHWQFAVPLHNSISPMSRQNSWAPPWWSALGSLPWSSSTPCRKSWSCHEGPAPSWYLKEIAMAELQRLHHGCRSFCNPCILYANMCRELLDFTLATSPDISISRSWKQNKPFYASEVLNSLKPMAAMVFRESFLWHQGTLHVCRPTVLRSGQHARRVSHAGADKDLLNLLQQTSKWTVYEGKPQSNVWISNVIACVHI